MFWIIFCMKWNSIKINEMQKRAPDRGGDDGHGGGLLLEFPIIIISFSICLFFFFFSATVFCGGARHIQKGGQILSDFIEKIEY